MFMFQLHEVNRISDITNTGPPTWPTGRGGPSNWPIFGALNWPIGRPELAKCIQVKKLL